jgi:hypothetical protein
MHVNNLRRNRKMAVQKNACLEIRSWFKMLVYKYNLTKHADPTRLSSVDNLVMVRIQLI